MNFEFGSFSLDVDRQELAGPEGPIDIEPQVFALLALLVSNSDRVVSKDEIIEHVWDGRAISDANLNTRINAARRAVGDDGKTQAVIRTFPRRGFRFVADIQQTAPTPAQRERNGRSRVLVLPFRNQSSDPEMDYLAETLTEDVIAVLSRSPQFIVTPRAAAFAYRNDDVNVGELWREHGIRYVVEGSIRRMGHRLQISALLNHAEDDIVIWSDKYVRDDDDVFAMGEDVTSRIVAAVGPTMGQTDRRRAMAADDPGAWEYYLRGNSLIFDVGKMDEATSQRERLQAEWPGISCAGIVQTTPMTKPEMIDLIVNAMRKAGLPE